MSTLRRTAVLLFLIAVAALALVAGPLTPSAHADNPLPAPITHQHFNGVQGPITQDGDGAVSVANYRNPPSPICSTSGSGTNVNTDCEGTAPHNETSIAVNPTNSANLIGSANDYQILLTSGGTVYETTYSRAHVSFNGGQT